MYSLDLNCNTGDVYVRENLVECNLSSLINEDDKINCLNELSDDSFFDYDNEKNFVFNVSFLNEDFHLSMIYNSKKLRLINFKLIYKSYDDFDLKMGNLTAYFDKTNFLNKHFDDEKPYVEYFYSWGVIALYSDLSLNIYFSIRWE
ncbi:hypothetical protein [Acinetobacter shaoyimingii]|uniref:Uncharacterized protein n=1 Tax=Acinetobacter shaoyimingii TaxID=2715164 RepID=A0A6G8RUM2_9GAMM|nr:hypothetical protein [Acinetobacter shaoyimingii]QIO05488.1 hypothetical protein G8E00_05755 [Acinetobacter shaoyimingii]